MTGSSEPLRSFSFPNACPCDLCRKARLLIVSGGCACAMCGAWIEITGDTIRVRRFSYGWPQKLAITCSDECQEAGMVALAMKVLG
jgi:7-cyano-7-deazaguanine synthase in queuosine biosynthesis